MSQAFHGGLLEAAKKEFGRADFLDFSASVNIFWSAANRSEWGNWIEAIFQYPEPEARLVTKRLETIYGVPPGQLLPTSGAIEALYLAARLFADGRVAIVEPAFADYARAFKAAGCEPVRVVLPPERWNAPLGEWSSVLEPHDVIALGRPNNPTAGLQTRDSLLQIIEAPWAHGKVWVIDEAFIEFVDDPEGESLLPLIERIPSVIILRSLTKSWGIPGLRLGFLATSNPAWHRQLTAMQPPWSINAVAQAWAKDRLTPQNCRTIRASLKPLPALRAMLVEELGRIPGVRVHPAAANFVLIDLAETGQTASRIYRALGQQGILVRTGQGFYGLEPERYIRLAVRREEENRRLVLALSPLLRRRVQPAHRVAALVPRARSLRPGKPMKALSILGTSSNSGKSWMATALCAWLRRQGFKVAPFKAQNMSNNSYVTPEGGEIGRAQAAQAEACGLLPSVQMNPILLKPSGQLGSQLVVLGQACGHVKSGEYYRLVEELWPVVCQALDYWRDTCDVLVLEGAGSPVELNLTSRDLVNLRPVRHLDGKWLLVSDIERGGVFAQLVGTWQLLGPADRDRAMGVIVNKFRGDLSLFEDAGEHLARHIVAPYLGVVPYRADLQPESEDSLCGEAEECGDGNTLAWIRFPHLSNSQDCKPWSLDQGVRVCWVTRPDELAQAAAIVLPGSKNTMADLRWLGESGLSQAIVSAAHRGVPVVGICGGFQMLGRRLVDSAGTAGDQGDAQGLSLLPVETWFRAQKEVRQVRAAWNGEIWSAYVIHMGQSATPSAGAELLRIEHAGEWRGEGVRCGHIWGTYLHGLFESSAVRAELASLGRIAGHRPAKTSWRNHLQAVYDGMADLIETHLNLEGLRAYVEA